MGINIHARNTPKGVRFRMWSTETDRYITAMMTEAEAREWARQHAIAVAIAAYEREIDARIARTTKNGTSCMIGGTSDLNGPWDEQQR